jgi:putative transposase
MPYPRRIEAAGLTYHVNTKGVAGASVFRDDEDRGTFLRLLRDEVERSRWSCLAYSLLSTHYHVLITLKEPTLSSGLQRLNGRFARAHNLRHGRKGALWQRRFHDSMIESESHFLEVTRYIALNACRANVSTRPEDWPWCSYGSTVGRFPPDPIIDEDAILGLFAPDRSLARKRYRRFVEERDPRARRSQTRLRDVSETERET